MRCVSILVLVLSLSGAMVAMAANGPIQAAESTVSLGVMAGLGEYEEDLDPQSTEVGPLIGVTAGVSALVPGIMAGYRFPDFYTNVSYDFSNGFLGSLHSSPGQTEGSETEGSEQYNTAIVRLGLGGAAGAGGEVIPYFAGGYQNWRRSAGGGLRFGAASYQAGLVGGGMKVDVADSPTLVLSAAAEGFAVVGGSVSVPSAEFSTNFGPSAEERVSLDADYRLNRSWHAFAGLGVTHYEYNGFKPAVGESYDPLSSTFQLNSMFGVAYGF